MSTKPQTTAQPPKQARSRKAAVPDPSAGRAGSAGGVVLSREAAKKPSTGKVAAVPSKDTKTDAKVDVKPDAKAQDVPKKKPRKLNREPTATSSTTAQPPRPTTDLGELEALKSRVRGLEAKVEDLYKTSTAATSTPRSPRRRGKGRKNSSATTTATLGNLSKKDAQLRDEEDGPAREEEDAEEELERLESELETARHDLALYTPHPRRRTTSHPNNNNNGDEDEVVEEIPRPAPRTSEPERQVTLSGSYRIPLPASLNPEDVRTIQSGVSAAQNVARSFLDQRRAARGSTTTSTSGTTSASASARARNDGGADGEVGSVGKTDGQTWGDWIGGYSVAISRAVRSIEHEAGVEGRQGQSQGQRKKSQGQRKRPGAATRLSGEQVQGLMG